MQSVRSAIIRYPDRVLLSLRHGSEVYREMNLSVARMNLIPIDYFNKSYINRGLKYLEGRYLIYQLLAQMDMNIGHFIFDDVFGLYSNLKQFRSTRVNVPSENYVLAHNPCSSFPMPLDKLCDKFTEGIFPIITSNPVRSIDFLLNSSERLCFRQLVAGQGIAGAVGQNAKNLHRARIFDEFRSDLLNVHHIDPISMPREHHIGLVEKHGRRNFQNLDEIYFKIRTTPQYMDIRVSILKNFVNMTIADQLKLFQTLTIVISPCGGISMLFSFLPSKATLIVSGYPKIEKNRYGPGRLEAVYWDYQSHLNVLHYPVDSLDDFELSDRMLKDKQEDLKHEAKVILRTEKLFPLIDSAIIRAALKY
ncbi:unnamed protein product [Rotaria magnacalcarata]|uniref:Uncharacterized protein n=1 Tax=Rotaria magnacalcarata TaxID=392030 RepID=A0A817AE37_9BILA|nr:unnamed protein product [Rotaria magnacalcarata]CAF4149760.1 unnamed protein product [Rotaria magnacalcarata]